MTDTHADVDILRTVLSLGRQMAIARENAGFDQDEIGNVFGVSRSTVSRWERDLQVPPFDVVVEWARVTEWPLELLVDAAARNRPQGWATSAAQSPRWESNPRPAHYE